MSDTQFPTSRTVRLIVRPKTSTERVDNTGGLSAPLSRLERRTIRAEPAWDDGVPTAATGAQPHSGPIPLRGGNTSGRGRADGNPLRRACGRDDHERPNFNLKVPPNGYAWWYVDGISDKGDQAISIIGFIGSVFSPWYKWSGRKDPENHVCLNVATYGRGGRFTMTDRGRSALRQTRDIFTVGPSEMRWENNGLTIDINEISAPPIIGPVRGYVRLCPEAVSDVELLLTPDGAHVWRPFAPVSRIEVHLEKRGWQWKGHGYFDANFGTRALEEDFDYWTWGRFPTERGAYCFYDAQRCDGSELAAGFCFDAQGRAGEIALPPKRKFARSLWQVARETRSEADHPARQVMNMLDAPFYSRSMIETRLNGENVIGVHEALDLTRFRSPFLKPMLACRVPRRAAWRN